ncbi:hypothetical protein [Actinomadura sp. 9N215]|uniref:hypothetical protein n=1 Tax=Actinomadura sp. 9N215 TaxID=3375150 RepID=UPI00379BC224
MGKIKRVGFLVAAFALAAGVLQAPSSAAPRERASTAQTILMVWKGVEGDQQIWWNTFNGSSWSGPQQVPGASTSFRPAIAVGG